MNKEVPALLIVVEGINDRTALSSLSTLYRPKDFKIITTAGDLTTQKGLRPQNIKAALGRHINRFLKIYGYTKKDILWVWFITDMDGSFVSEESIEQQEGCKKFTYTPDKIICNDKSKALARNNQKKSNLIELLKTKTITGLPLRLFFMSCNFDHVICGNANCSPEEKDTAAEMFLKSYSAPSQRPEFEEFFFKRMADPGIPEDYNGSWNFIQQTVHSLQRGSNFYLALKELDESLASSRPLCSGKGISER